MKRVLICAAVPRELKYVYGNLSCSRGQRRTSGPVLATYRGHTQVILHRTGIGAANAEASIKSLMNDLRPDLIMSVGFAGALYEGASAGDLFWASRFLYLSGNSPDGKIAEISDIPLPDGGKIIEGLAGLLSLRQGCIVTLEHSLRKDEIRKRLPDGISFPVCDMETFVLARSAVRQHVPFFAARSISDASGEDIPSELFDINDESGKIVHSRLLKSVFQKPSLVKDIVRLGINSEKAAKSLGDLIKSFLDASIGFDSV
jgi:nucleoside phosphorylase